ncbi:RING/FYVE/PHD zinc finger superfamily protein [Rhynchospora pubera]|uniref:RING/FYVE/PHD zinc finger superfamily protein n=1 Tax=Rhynchospora pubera TaxID=906938 RepID=A0AAV8AJ29_9POAL|nr:RING/FYVE/PHD zinc finger superfamily protein [Rhynchospora pubera]KAJ4781853.1 RING/FYVE/PHD zinc finger superfamily protein [Rhynchospora pubera]KAJ4788761.1 RING/FYVE/PHD zinc finger superfamily protein [Rhynchospora pubera]KAJ4808283.1 RING/FYVE/PHD zinc finger superfamily protein [Rhynchospora pubera]
MEYDHKSEMKREVGMVVLEVVEYDDDLASTRQCRICHEEELECSTSMESPCACSGSLQFAHRECVQRWCDEKGSTVCEICLQNFEPGYTVPPKISQPVDVAVTIRGSLDVPRQIHGAIDEANLGYAECSAPAPSRGASCCRLIAMTFAILLLLRHLMDLVLFGADQYEFRTLLITFSLRAIGILLPFYIMLRLISAIQHGQRQYLLEQIQLRRSVEQLDRSRSEEENPRRYTIQIFS